MVSVISDEAECVEGVVAYAQPIEHEAGISRNLTGPGVAG